MLYIKCAPHDCVVGCSVSVLGDHDCYDFSDESDHSPKDVPPHYQPTQVLADHYSHQLHTHRERGGGGRGIENREREREQIEQIVRVTYLSITQTCLTFLDESSSVLSSSIRTTWEYGHTI